MKKTKLISNFVPLTHSKPTFKLSAMQKITPDTVFDSIFKMLSELKNGNYSFRIGNPEQTDYLAALIPYLNFVAHSLEAAAKKGSAAQIDTEIPEDLTDRIIISLHDYIIENIDEQIPPLNLLAKKYFTNERKLQQGFKQHYGKNIYNFLLNQRLQKANRLLTQTHRPIKSIAYECGFNSYHAFYMAFKTHFGYTPGSLRKTVR